MIEQTGHFECTRPEQFPSPIHPFDPKIMYTLSLAARQTHTGRLGPTVARCALPAVSNAAASASTSVSSSTSTLVGGGSASLSTSATASANAGTGEVQPSHAHFHAHTLNHIYTHGAAAATGMPLPGLGGIGGQKTGFRSRFGWSRWRRRRLHTTAVRRDDIPGGHANRTDGMAGDKKVPLRSV